MILWARNLGSIWLGDSSVHVAGLGSVFLWQCAGAQSQLTCHLQLLSLRAANSCGSPCTSSPLPSPQPSVVSLCCDLPSLLAGPHGQTLRGPQLALFCLYRTSGPEETFRFLLSWRLPRGNNFPMAHESTLSRLSLTLDSLGCSQSPTARNH